MRRSGATIFVLLVAGASVAAGCPRGNESTSSGATRAPSRRGADGPGAPGSKVVRVGNQVGGVEDQPDYDAEAEAVRRQVEGRLPRPLLSADAACIAMLDAVHQYYRTAEGADSEAARTTVATRDRDLAGCKRDTSAVAASCVAVLMADQTMEYPRALDQCARAFRGE